MRALVRSRARAVAAGATLWGVRPDIAEKAGDVFFLMENAALLLLALLAARSAFELSVPGGERTAAIVWGPLLGFLLWPALLLARDRLRVDATELALAARSGLPCVWRSSVLGALPVVAGGVM